MFLETDLRQGTKQQQDQKASDQHQVCVASPLHFSTRGGLSEGLWAPGLRSKAAYRASQNSITGVSKGRWGGGGGTVCSICSNLASAFLLALGSLGRQGYGPEILFMP